MHCELQCAYDNEQPQCVLCIWAFEGSGPSVFVFVYVFAFVFGHRVCTVCLGLRRVWPLCIRQPPTTMPPAYGLVSRAFMLTASMFVQIAHRVKARLAQLALSAASTYCFLEYKFSDSLTPVYGLTYAATALIVTALVIV